MSTSVTLVEQTIESLKESGKGIVVVCGPGSDPSPLTEAQRSGIEATGVTVPESMKRWLAFDALSLDLFDSEGAFEVTSLRGFLLAELEEIAAELDEGMAEEIRSGLDWMLGDYVAIADAPAIVLPPSASQAHVLVLDGSEEPPVLGYEKEQFWEKYPSFGACIAHIIGNRSYDEIGPDWAKK